MAASTPGVKAIFDHAVEIESPSERDAYLANVCAGRRDLHEKVEALLRAYVEAGSFLESAPGVSPPADATGTFAPDGLTADSAASTADYSGRDESVGAILAGKYKLIEEIGEGGMGSVFMAQQTEPVKRAVAVKVIKAGMDSKAVLARFEAERQALAMMDHPNIAKVLDAGTTDAGRPFFVMELVKGTPITRYSDEHKLTPRQRLELFVPVCQAIQHAHQKGIIHRDIKPSNVLIALYDDKPVPKVIDFGVAKATGGALTESTIDTGFGGVVGTPQYMSPEQATFNNIDIDTRSDVYSLGVLLYELLAGSPPFAKKELEKRGLLEILRVVREEEPPRPSTKLSTAEGLPSLSANRGTEPKKLTGILRNELDWIVMKALEKSRARRYETANWFAADVNRYLSGEAVLAHPPSRGYRIKKFVRRNRGQVIAASLVLFALLGGIAGTTIGLIEAKRQEWATNEAREAEAARAEGERLAKLDAEAKTKLAQAETAAKEAARAKEAEERRYAEAISAFVRDDFLGLTSVEGQGRFGGDFGAGGLDRNATLMTLLDRAADKLKLRKDLDPQIEAELCWIIGVNYRGAGMAVKGVPFLERAVELRRRVLGADHAYTLNDMNSLGACYAAAQKLDLAVPLWEETLKLSKTKLGPDHPTTLLCSGNLAAGYHQTGKSDLALPLYEETLPLMKAKLGPDHPMTLGCMGNLADGYRSAGQLNKSLSLYEETLPLMKAKLGPDHPDTLAFMNNLAHAYQDSGKTAEAVRLLEVTLEKMKAKLGPDHPRTLSTTGSLASAYLAAGQLAKALPLMEVEFEAQKKNLGPDHPSTLLSLNNLALAYQKSGQVAKAVPLFEQGFEKTKAKLGPDHPSTLLVLNNLALAYREDGQLARAVPLLEQAMEKLKDKLGADHPSTLNAMGSLGKVYAEAKRGDEAATTYLKFFAGRRKREPKDSLPLAGLLAQASIELLGCGQHPAAELLLRESLATREKKEPNSWNTFKTQSLLGESLLGQKKYKDAEPLLLKGYEGMKAREKDIPKTGGGELRIPESLDRLIALYTATEKPDEVKKYQELRAKYPAAPQPR